MQISGIWAALPTPYTPEGALDECAWHHHLSFLGAQGVQGVIIAGCTGEILAVDPVERCYLVEKAVAFLPTSCKIFVGIAAQSARMAALWINEARDAGASGALVLTPLLLRQPTSTALVAYFGALHEATDVPLVIYENPSRAGVTLSLETLLALAAYPRILGLKDATSRYDRPQVLLRALKAAGLHNKFSLMCGEDSLYVPFLVQGAQGLMGVAPNLVPGLYQALQQAWQRGDTETLGQLNAALSPVITLLNLAPNPMALKAALQHIQGFSWQISRLPLDSLTEDQRTRVSQLWAQIENYQHTETKVTEIYASKTA